MKKIKEENISKFNHKFIHLYNDLPTEIKPYEVAAIASYSVAHDSEFVLYLK